MQISSDVTRFVLLIFFLNGLFACRTASEQVSNEELLTDIDGNSYRTVQIGDQVWMAENLRTTRYNDGTPITKVEYYDEWAELTLPAYCWYNNDSSNGEAYGALYNGYVIESGELCPDGWQVPSDEDWLALEATLGGADVAGGALKEDGTDVWKTPNTGATNESGFTARPGGYRSYNGTFNLKRTYAYWWSSTLKSWYGAPPRFIYRVVQYKDQNIYRDIAENNNGLSVRCVKNP